MRRFLSLIFAAHFAALSPVSGAPLINSYRFAAAGGGGIAFDALSSAAPTGGTSLTVAHTCSGSNRALFVSCSLLGAASVTITGITYNGVAMTQLWQGDQSGGVEAKSSGWILIAPATGTNNIVATYSALSLGYTGFAASSWTGVNQTGTVGNSWRTPVVAPDGSTDPSSVIVTTAVTGDVVLDGYGAYNTSGVSVANNTSRVIQDPHGTNYAHGHQSHAATGSTTMSWTNTGGFYSAAAVALIPAP